MFKTFIISILLMEVLNIAKARIFGDLFCRLLAHIILTHCTVYDIKKLESSFYIKLLFRRKENLESRICVKVSGFKWM
jgi:hypothetical protein